MSAIDAASFSAYARNQWAASDFQVSEVGDAPYRDRQKALTDGFSAGMSVAWGDAQTEKARVGIWFRPAPRGSLNDLGALRSHYQTTLAQQGRGCRIHNCNTEFGPIFLFWETTAPLPQDVFKGWVARVEELTGLCFDGDALDEYLGKFR